MIRSNYYSIVVLILAGLLLGSWYLWRDHFTDLPGRIVQSNQPDYSIEKFRSRVFSESGQLQYEMKSDTLAHYPLDNTLQMEKPWIQLHKGEGAPWIIKSEKGIAPSNDVFIFSGNVNVDGIIADDPGTHANIADQTIIQQRQHINMKTETLTLQINNKIVSTNDFVTILTEMDIIESTGLEVDLSKDVLLLQNNVKGTYKIEGTSKNALFSR